MSYQSLSCHLARTVASWPCRPKLCRSSLTVTLYLKEKFKNVKCRQKVATKGTVPYCAPFSSEFDNFHKFKVFVVLLLSSKRVSMTIDQNWLTSPLRCHSSTSWWTAAPCSSGLTLIATDQKNTGKGLDIAILIFDIQNIKKSNIHTLIHMYIRWTK